MPAAAGTAAHLVVELPTNVVLAERFIDAMRLSGGMTGTDELVQTVCASIHERS